MESTQPGNRTITGILDTYFEAGYGGRLSIRETDLLDYAFVVIYSDSTLLGGSSDTNFVFTLSKTLISE